MVARLKTGGSTRRDPRRGSLKDNHINSMVRADLEFVVKFLMDLNGLDDLLQDEDFRKVLLSRISDMSEDLQENIQGVIYEIIRDE